MAILYLLLLVSIVSETVKNICTNFFGKNLFISMSDSFLFNTVSGIGATVFFIIATRSFEISSYSFVLAIVFSVLSAMANFFSLMAVATGPMAASTLLVYMGGIIIPAVFGITYYHQPVKLTQIIGCVLMIISLFLCINLKKDKRMTPRWLMFSVGSFISWGLIGICQQIHQSSEYAYELNEFLLWSFIMMTVLFGVIYFFIKNKDAEFSGYKIKDKASFLVVLSGILIGAVYMINLYLAGKLPGIVFFPIVNGGVMLLSAIAAIAFFKEKTDAKQIIGIIAGIASIALLGI